MPADVSDLAAYRSRRLGTAAPLRSVQGEARPGLVVLHLPSDGGTLELSPAKARIWLELLGQLIDSAEALEREGDRG